MVAINSRPLSYHNSGHLQSQHSLQDNYSHVTTRSSGSELAGYNLGSYHEVTKERRDDYKPSTLRMPFLATLLASLLVLIGLMAYSLHALPRKDVDDSLLDLVDGAIKRRGLNFVANRRETATTLLTMTVPDINSDSTTSTTNDDSSATASPVPSVTEPSITKASTPLSSSETITTVRESTAAPDESGHLDTSASKSGTSGIPLTTTPTAATASAAVVSSGDFAVITTSVSVTDVLKTTASSPTSSIHTNTKEAGDAVLKTSARRETTPTVDTPLSDSHGDGDQDFTVFVATSTTKPVKTYVNSEGLTTYTSTWVASARSSPATATLENPAERRTTIITTSIPVTPVFSTVTNSTGAATTTIVIYPTITTATENTQVFYISSAEYFVGFCLPTLLSIIIAIPIRTLSTNARLFQPWHALTQPSGVVGFASLTLPTCDFKSYANGLRCFLDGQFLIFMTTILMFCSILLVPLSAESIILELRGNCAPGTAKGCTFQLCVSEVPAKTTLALLAFMCFLVVMITVSLWTWESGVYANPWSICGVAGLMQNKEIRALFTRNARRRCRREDSVEDSLSAAVANRRFQLGWYRDDGDKMQYGVMLAEYHPDTAYSYHDTVKPQEEISVKPGKGMNSLPFMLGYSGRLLFLALLVGLLALILYYNNTGGDTAFERFMDGQSFGTKFLFTSTGTVLTLFWSSFVSSVAIVSPYQLLSQRPQRARHSILLSPPTNAFSSLLSGIRRRHILLAVMGVTALLSEFLTIFLSNVPYRASQTFLAAQICAYGSIGIIATMTLVVASSLFIKWPHMPVDPSTIAGAMYYVCDSWILRDLKHFSETGRRDCNTRMDAMNKLYTYREFVGQSGILRIGVDTVDDELRV